MTPFKIKLLNKDVNELESGKREYISGVIW